MNTHKSRILLIVALLIATSVAYWPVRTFEFVNYDDNDYVYQNGMVLSGLTTRSIASAFTAFHAANWHPLTWISHMTDVQLFGPSAGPHHVMNVLLHLLNVALLFTVISRLTGAPWRSAVVAAIFALHPLNVETVAWISERKSLLSTTAWLLAIGAYARWTVTRRMRDYALVVVSFAAGLMSKPMIVTLPAMLLAVDIWPLRRFSPRELLSREALAQGSRLVVEKLPLFVLSGVSSVITYLAQASRGAVASESHIALPERLLNALVSFGWYVAKLFIPTDLAVLHPHPATLQQMVSKPAALVSLMLALFVFSLALRLRNTKPYLLSGLLWYAITLLPVIGIIQVGLQAHADRYAYVPLIGVIFALVWLLADGARSLRCEAPAFAAAMALVVVASVLTRTQVNTWRNSETLFLQALHAHDGDNPVAKHNLMSHHTFTGDALKQRGDYRGALTEFWRALQYEPNFPTALHNYGAALADVERFAEALEYYRRALRIDQRQPDAWLHAGDALVMLGRPGEAISSYERALSLRPRDKYALYGLAFSCVRVGNMACAQNTLAQLQPLDAALARNIVAQVRQATTAAQTTP